MVCAEKDEVEVGWVARFCKSLGLVKGVGR